MIKEFAKISNKVEVQITLTKHEEGLKAKIVFIPIVEGPAMMPVEAWGTPDEVLNSIRYNLFQKEEQPLEDIEVEEVKIIELDDEENEEVWPTLTQVNPGDIVRKTESEEIKEKIVKKSGIPKDNIIVAKPKPLPRHDEVGELEPNTLVETQPPSKIPIMMEEEFSANEDGCHDNDCDDDFTFPDGLDEPFGKTLNVQIVEKEIKRCSKCTLPIDSVKQDECIYKDCPEGKHKPKEAIKKEEATIDMFGSLDQAPKDADNYMVEEELRNRPKFIPPTQDLYPSDVPEWAEQIEQSYHEARNNQKM